MERDEEESGQGGRVILEEDGKDGE